MQNLGRNPANSAVKINEVVSLFFDGASASSVSKDLNFLLNQFIASESFDGSKTTDKDLILEVTRITQFITELQELSRNSSLV